MVSFRPILGSVLAIALAGCGSRVVRAPSIAEVYAGPESVPLRKDLGGNSAVAATVTHGEPLDVIEARRRFVKVRTARGVEGWTDVRMLMSAQQMSDLRALNARAAALPSQGTAVAGDAVNLHTGPSRSSPGFAQIPEKGSMEVLDRALTLRNQPAPTLLSWPKRARRRTPGKPVRPWPLNLPPAPAPPSNWVELSKIVYPPEPPPKDEAELKARKRRKRENPGPPMDDWTLARTRDGKVGWVLSRMIVMAIPDEVAQYAEGQRITSYFALARIEDGDLTKYHWLWTTLSSPRADIDFDGFRVFIWNRNHHRYETSYRQRDLAGHYPARVDKSGKNPVFTLVFDGEAGRRERHVYVLEGYKVRPLGTAPGDESAADAQVVPAPAGKVKKEAPPTWLSRVKRVLGR